MPPIDAEKIDAQRCYRCSQSYEPWDGKVHPSLWSRDLELGRIHGLGDRVSEEHVRQELRVAEDTTSRFALETRIFFDTLEPNDAIYCFCSPSADWQRLAGRSGYAIVRGEAIVAAIVTMLN